MKKCCFNCKNSFGLNCGMMHCKIESPDSNYHYYDCCCEEHEMATEEQMKERNAKKRSQPYIGVEVGDASDKYVKGNEYIKEAFEQTFCDGANFALDKVITFIETNRIWTGMGWKINCESLMNYIETLHGYPREEE